MAAPGIYPPLFKGLIASAAVQRIGVPVGDGNDVFLDVSWPDATSSATIVWQETSLDSVQAPVTEVDAAQEHWKTNASVTITGPAASAAGSFKVRVIDCAARRVRLVVTAAADTLLEVHCDVKKKGS